MTTPFNEWEFSPKWSEDFLYFRAEAEAVRLPHSVKPLPLHCASPADYETVCGYRKKLFVPADWTGKHVFLRFDGAAHIASLYVNGIEVSAHFGGYTAFRTEITDYLRSGEENLLAVRLDTTENAQIPPFGFAIDYLTYGGLYREAFLELYPESYIEDAVITTPELTRAHIELTLVGTARRVRIRILNAEESCDYELTGSGDTFDLTFQDAKAWSPEHPNLYTCEITLMEQGGQPLDIRRISFGFRTAEWKADGFYLNGEKYFIRGLNRHQSYPVIGYAAPEHLQREDARILKEELCCNLVRTSHYPQSQYFIDECDRLGLLVFTEIPGWQHIGDEGWQLHALDNLKEMILQYRNHVSIVLWGVRINESQDNDDFYTQANTLAHRLDRTRATGGVRYLEQSHLLEDVYTFNDFSYNGRTAPVRPKKKVTPDMNKALLITECNGHMYPTKAWDPWEKRQEHALRHAAVMRGAMASGEHAGCIEWCMFDYQTHQDFGSGDRICYHGVTDMFRNPKLAASFYASQGEEKPVLAIGSSMDIGDYPAGYIGDIYAFTNADEVELYKNGDLVKSFTPPEGALPHEPILIDDKIGDLLETKEGYKHKKADLIRRCLLAAEKDGFNNLSLIWKLRLAWCMLRYGLKFEDGVRLYGQYIAGWGGKTTSWRFVAKKDGAETASVTLAPSAKLHLEAVPSKTVLDENGTYDMAALRIRVADEYGNTVPYAALPIRLSVAGAAELVGPETVVAEGGMTGCYVKSAGRSGTATLRLTSDQTDPVTLYFEINA